MEALEILAVKAVAVITVLVEGRCLAKVLHAIQRISPRSMLQRISHHSHPA